MKRLVLFWSALVLWAGPGMVFAAEVALSPATQDCIGCHETATPALVADWKRSRHSRVTVAEALSKPELRKRVSADKVPDALLNFAVGCAECHVSKNGSHKDTFDHGDMQVHLTVTPKDCATCHPVEASEYEKNLMSHARHNLVNNQLYQGLIKAVNGGQTFRDGKTILGDPDDKTNADSCYQCHGTAVEVKGKQSRSTDYGDMEFLVLSGWPNVGVGRSNPDGSQGSCTACHSRHQFAIQLARKPYTCAQCHKGPDVPAYKAYFVSKHGNAFSALYDEWNFKEVPWTVGKDFVGPTCAVCHISLLTTPDGEVVAKRTHQMSDRLPWRILGLIYSHPHPKSPDTSIIKNKDGVQLPVTLNGEPAQEFLITNEEQAERQKKLQKVCQACHASTWVQGHWDRFLHTLKTSNEMTLAATQLMQKAWNEKLCDPNESLFDEALEKKWGEQWLFYGNSTRFASAMMGADYGVFANGRWFMAKNLQEMLDHLKFLAGSKPQPSKK